MSMQLSPAVLAQTDPEKSEAQKLFGNECSRCTVKDFTVCYRGKEELRQSLLLMLPSSPEQGTKCTNKIEPRGLTKQCIVLYQQQS